MCNCSLYKTRSPQIILADETTKLLHGEACLKEIHQTVKQVFAGGVGGSNAALPRYGVLVSFFG